VTRLFAETDAVETGRTSCHDSFARSDLRNVDLYNARLQGASLESASL
jgi:uncharacterized protein YjbI with pentapeptide repeats